MIIPRHEYDNMVTEINTLRAANKQLLAERDLYRNAWDDLQSFCLNFTKDKLSSMYGKVTKDLDFPATTKQPENKIY